MTAPVTDYLAAALARDEYVSAWVAGLRVEAWTAWGGGEPTVSAHVHRDGRGYTCVGHAPTVRDAALRALREAAGLMAGDERQSTAERGRALAALLDEGER